MNRNPLMPLAAIAILGIVLMVVISFWGLNNSDKMLAAQEEKGQATEEQAAAPAGGGAEELVKGSCAGCHGQNLEGGVGPALADVGSRLSAEEITTIINNGRNAMPPGVVDAAKAEQIAAFLTGGEAAPAPAPAEEGGKAEAEAAPAGAEAEGLVKASCVGCHGQNLEGGMGPALEAIGGKLSADEIANVINNGQNAMPPGVVDAEKAKTIAAWLAEKK